jgi:hypothetical protein
VVVAGRALRNAAAPELMAVLASSCALVWLVFILTGKVGSPQYLLWLAPLVPLGFLRTKWDYRAAGLFVAASLLTTLTYPYLWTNVHGPAIPGEIGVWSGPNALGYALLLAKWSALGAYALWLYARLELSGPAKPHA